jgi:hypothetical protein
LINPAQDRLDWALRDLSGIFTQYTAIPPDKMVGLHMALGLLNERMCRNNDLAIKEFKDAVACSRKIGLKCDYYNIAHFQLGIINLRLREGNQLKPEFESKRASYHGTTEDLMTATPTPVPSPTVTPTPQPNPLKITIEIPFNSRTLKQKAEKERLNRASGIPGATVGENKPRGIPGATVGETGTETSPTPRPVRLRPRLELGDIQQMKGFRIEDLYDLGNIPVDAIREFEQYLQCSSDASRARIARFIHDKYMGK